MENSVWVKENICCNFIIITLAYLLIRTSVFAKPVTDAFESDELMLTGPSPWNILMRFNFIGSIVSIAVKPSIPDNGKSEKNLGQTTAKTKKNIQNEASKVAKTQDHHTYLLSIVWTSPEYSLENKPQNSDHQFDMFLANHLETSFK